METRRRSCWGMCVIVSLAWGLTAAQAEEAQWIWSPQHAKEQVPEGACFFRKAFQVRSPEQAQVLITADDNYELYVNGRKIGEGPASKRLDEYDISRFVGRGHNTLAIKVANTNGSTAALVARVLVKERGGGWTAFSTDSTWLTNLRPLPLWNTNLYNDSQWVRAQVFGPLGDTPPWDRKADVAVEEKHRSERFTVSREFEVQRVLDGEQTGSLLAIAFNEFGHILVSREGGPLLLVHDSNNDHIPDRVRVYCDKVKNCQGILPLNGEVFVTADGPEGAALYRLSDANRDGTLDNVRAIVKFGPEMGEHGPHGIALGADGLLYIIVGNMAQLPPTVEAHSPHHDYYEGDLVQPRYEDPGGHARGVHAPGGTVIRTDVDGSSVQIVAGGIRNAYDMAFNREGELFVHDSDMEADVGAPWYRPTQLYHILPGGEYGWRSGWAWWPPYAVDNLPPVLETGRGSPTGAVVYDHVGFPAQYHNALFLADWSEGRILAVTLKRQGAGYVANTEVFVEGQPLNVTDLDVGPDGWLYFVTGGRGTSGGIYRVMWKGQVPPALTQYSNDLSEVIRQPQFHSAWGRQNIARLKKKIGPQWPDLVQGVALSTANPTDYRTRALDILQLFGPIPSTDLLVTVSTDPNENVRAKAVEFLGLHHEDAARDRLEQLLADPDRLVRRKACEALARMEAQVTATQLRPLLMSDDREEAWAARRLLELQPEDSWRDTLLADSRHRVVIQSGLALVIAHPSPENARLVVERIQTLMGAFVSDGDFIDMLRLLQVALLRGPLRPEELGDLRQQLTEEFPAGNAHINRELMRLLAYLQESSIIDRYLAYLASDVDDAEKLHVAFQLRFIESGWTSAQKLKLLEFLEQAGKRVTGSSVPLYIMYATRDFARQLTAEEALQVLERGAQWPNAALGALSQLPAQLDDDTRALLERLDESLVNRTDDANTRLKTGIVAALARSGDSRSQELLRKIWERDPLRRPMVALGLAQFDDQANWSCLVRTLPQLDDSIAKDILVRLQSMSQVPDNPEPYRQTIILALRWKGNVAREAVTLLEHWTGETRGDSQSPAEKVVADWQSWFHSRYPDQAEARLPEDRADAKWKFAELLEYLEGEEGAKGSAENGALVFRKALCIKCHRVGDQGETTGPDLSGLARRFTTRDILESILFPSQVISSQYAAKTLRLLDGRILTGIVAAGPHGELTVLTANAEKIPIRETDVEDSRPSTTSAMPEGLLDPLTLQEIRDLATFLKSPPVSGITRRLE